MFSSFTKDEKKLFLFFLGMLVLGALVLPVFRARQSSEVFGAGEGSVLATRPPGAVVTPLAQQTTAPAVLSGHVELNAASVEILESLPGIGPNKAAAIVAYRQQHGPFRTLAELDGVRGIGPALIERLSAQLYVAVPLPSPTPVSAVSPASQAQNIQGQYRSGAPRQLSATGGVWANPGAQKTPTATPAGAVLFVPSGAVPATAATPPVGVPGRRPGVININTASAEQIATLRHVGPVLAQRIVEYRMRYGPFRRPEDLDAVKGIGPHIIEENRSLISVY